MTAIIAVTVGSETWMYRFDRESLALVYVKLEALLEDGVINEDTCDYLSYQAGQLAQELEVL